MVVWLLQRQLSARLDRESTKQPYGFIGHSPPVYDSLLFQQFESTMIHGEIPCHLCCYSSVATGTLYVLRATFLACPLPLLIEQGVFTQSTLSLVIE